MDSKRECRNFVKRRKCGLGTKHYSVWAFPTKEVGQWSFLILNKTMLHNLDAQNAIVSKLIKVALSLKIPPRGNAVS